MRKGLAVFSEGARYERKVILAKVRRVWKRCQAGEEFGERALQQLEGEIFDRRERYERKK